MKKQEKMCDQCEAEFYIEHDEESIYYCPFCANEFTTIEHEELDLEDLWDE